MLLAGNAFVQTVRESLTFVRIRVAQLAAMVGIEAGDEVAFDRLGDGTLRLRRAQADDAKCPATDYGARPSWANTRAGPSSLVVL